jgi:hypothetical protein
MATMKTKKGLVLIDDDLFDELNKYRWYIGNNGYAQNDSKPRKLMHRFIMGNPKENIDHINGNKLDNRKCNLRVCNQSGNTANGKIRINNKSGYRGVSWNKKYKKWESYLTKNYKHFFLGYFDNKKIAAKVYNREAKKQFGEFARLNKI